MAGIDWPGLSLAILAASPCIFWLGWLWRPRCAGRCGEDGPS